MNPACRKRTRSLPLGSLKRPSVQRERFPEGLLLLHSKGCGSRGSAWRRPIRCRGSRECAQAAAEHVSGRILFAVQLTTAHAAPVGPLRHHSGNLRSTIPTVLRRAGRGTSANGMPTLSALPQRPLKHDSTRRAVRTPRKPRRRSNGGTVRRAANRIRGRTPVPTRTAGRWWARLAAPSRRPVNSTRPGCERNAHRHSANREQIPEPKSEPVRRLHAPRRSHSGA